MAQRVVSVKLSAQVADFQKGMREAAQATREAGTEAEKLVQQKQAFEALGRTMLVAGGVMAAGVGLAVARYADFDQAMSNVIATGEDAVANQDALREAALEAGASTVYSATESANAIEELAKAGLSASDILGGGLAGSLDLAAAGGLGVADAAAIAATTLQQFELSGDQASHVADLLAAGAGKAMGDVSDLGEALNQAGLVANQFNIPVEETVGVLSAFASAGMLGSDAGTSMRTMLLRLANPTKEVTTLMSDLGIEAYNSQGQFIGLAGLAGELEDSLGGMTDAQRDQTLAMIFGQDAIRGANILLREGKDGIEEWTKAVDDQGYASDVAAQRLDNLKGDWEALTGAIDSALIASGEAADGPARALIQWLTEQVDIYNDMPASGQQAVFWIGAVAAAATLAGGAYFTAIPKVAEFNAAIDTMGPKAQKAARGIGVLAKIGGGALAGIAVTAAGGQLLIDWLDSLGQSSEVTANKVKTADSALDLIIGTAATFNGKLSTEEARRQLALLGDSLDGIRRGNEGVFQARSILTVEKLGKELGKLAATDLPSASSQFRLLAEGADLSESQQQKLLDKMPDFKKALLDQATAGGVAADEGTLLAMAMGEVSAENDVATGATEKNAGAIAALAGEAQNTEETVEDLADAIRGFGSAQFDVRDASRSFEEALDALQASVEENGRSLDITTSAGRANESALDDIAQSALDLAGSLYVTTGSQDEAAGAIQRGRDELIRALEQFGITGAEAEAYADKLGLIPGNIPTYVSLNTAPAQAALDGFIRTANGRQIRLDVVTDSLDPTSIRPSANGNMFDYAHAFAAGGGVDTGIYAGRAGSIHKFAEPETIWEAYISGKPDQRDRNIGIWQETGRRLGVESAPASVSIEGARLTGTLDLGNGLTGFVDARIRDAKRSEDVALSGGRASL